MGLSKSNLKLATYFEIASCRLYIVPHEAETYLFYSTVSAKTLHKRIEESGRKLQLTIDMRTKMVTNDSINEAK